MIKLADRLHNMRTLQCHMPGRHSRSGLRGRRQDIYAPIAQRLGISKIKVELDDLIVKISRAGGVLRSGGQDRDA